MCGKKSSALIILFSDIKYFLFYFTNLSSIMLVSLRSWISFTREARVINTLTITSMGNLESPINPVSVFLDCGMKVLMLWRDA